LAVCAESGCCSVFAGLYMIFIIERLCTGQINWLILICFIIAKTVAVIILVHMLSFYDCLTDQSYLSAKAISTFAVACFCSVLIFFRKFGSRTIN
jgi:hypothetical protein